MSIKMVVTDLDGTLLRSDKTISARTLSVLRQCREKGVKLAYATARDDSARALVPCELFHGYVQMNGLVAYAGDTLIHEKLVSAQSARQLLQAAHGAGIEIAAQRGGRHHANFDVEKAWTFMPEYVPTDFEDYNSDAEKLYTLTNTPQVAAFIENHLPPDLYFYFTWDGHIVVRNRQAVKINGILALAEHWGIDLNEVAAFGDDTNDLNMLQACGLGVAMENAVREAKDAADQICGANNDDGVAVWLEENVLSCCGSL